MKNEVQTLTEILLKGDQDAGWELILHQIQKGVDSHFLFRDLISEAMIAIGALWEEDEISVADEHLATATCDFLLARYQFYKKTNSPVKADKKAMFLCVEEEQHYLGLKMVNILFEENGWETRFLGPNLPAEYALKAAERWEPEVICLSFSIIYRAAGLREYIQSFESLSFRPNILLGGRLVSKYDFTHLISEKTAVIGGLEDLKCWLQ